MGSDFDLYCDQIDFNQIFQSKFEARFLLFATNSNKSFPDLIKKFNKRLIKIDNDRNQHSNLDGLESELLTSRFKGPHRLSLADMQSSKFGFNELIFY